MEYTDQQVIDKLKEKGLSSYQNSFMLYNYCLPMLKGDNVGLAVSSLKSVAGISKTEALHSRDFYNLYWKCIHTLALYDFDSYMIDMEKSREPKQRFYTPRREQLRKIGAVQLLQDLVDDVLDVGSLSVVPGAGKTTLEEFFATWVIGKYPTDFNIFASHSGSICRMFYDAIDNFTDSEEYGWGDIFPECKRISTNAKDLQINFYNDKPFKNISCVSVGQNIAGRVRANRFLFCDDLVSGIEVAVNKVRLEKLWQAYTVDFLQRRMDGCKELHIATRWSVHDPIGRLKLKYSGNPRARFISVPDIDPETGESNFCYKYGLGFSREYFDDIGATMDEVSYRCLYKNEPVEREGLLYPEDSIRRFLSLPDRDPDAVLGICDTKATGTDFMFLPCMYQYGDDYYMVDCICDDNSDYGVQYGRIVEIITGHNMDAVDFESNSGGDRVAREVQERLEEKESKCAVSMHYTTKNKETKIIVAADWIKKHVLFQDASLYKPNTDYGKAMSFLLTYTVAGRNPHDDVPDGLAQFVDSLGKFFRRETEYVDFPF